MVSQPQKPLPPNPKRQAAHVIGAFRFQLLETAIAWLNLAEADSLLIEIFEDFDVETTSGGTELTQVKHTTSDRTLTLASKDSREALENFWATSREGEVADVFFGDSYQYGNWGRERGKLAGRGHRDRILARGQ